MGKVIALVPSIPVLILLMNPPIITGIGLIVTGITAVYIVTGF